MVLQGKKYQSVLRRLNIKFGRSHNDWRLHRIVSRNRGKLYIAMASSLVLFSGTVVALQVAESDQSYNDQSAAVQSNENTAASLDLNAANNPAQSDSNNSANNTVHTETEDGQTRVSVNGQTVAVPNNGTTRSTVTGSGNDVNVTVSNHNGNTSVNTYNSSNSMVTNSGNTSTSSTFSTQSVMNSGGTP